MARNPAPPSINLYLELEILSNAFRRMGYILSLTEDQVELNSGLNVQRGVRSKASR